ncbi:MAG TPA: DUF4013 domain-containing protein [Syntrophorhabdaceae bacterium]|jgi:hypothetical protein|nr:DUF4013 domain-containing protein [Syntrophorhabdaceae bacterium]HOS05967.1 DUF4013 domain-containing protein [Syntrophorhabdaceae bacterium]HPL41604.1 DUF4013 domain-containing protein [Syntrophorhabdaceae bacterium]
MDIIPFIQFTLNKRYILRWVAGGIILFIPVANFLSLGYLSRSSRLLTIGSVGLPTWERKSEIWIEGIKLLFIFILYEAIPFFLFSFGFFLTALHSMTVFFGSIIKFIGYIALIVLSFFLPFAFAKFSENNEFRNALEFEKLINGIKEVMVPYVGGYLATGVILYILSKTVLRIPFIGFFVWIVLIYYTLLLATYYFTRLYTQTSLSSEKISEQSIVIEQ